MPNLNRTVLLKGDLGDRREEARANEIISPGMLIEELSTGKVQKNDTVAGNIQINVALEDPFYSRTIADDYQVDDLVSFQRARPNQKFKLRVAAAAAAIVVGDRLEPVAGGTVQKLAAGVAIARAEEALDNSGGATVEWIACTII